MKRTLLATVVLFAWGCQGIVESPAGDDDGAGDGTGDVGDGGDGDGGDGPPPGATVTYYKDVLPVVYARCVGCHGTGTAAFALDSYEAAMPMAFAMKVATMERRMPPWPPAPACGDFEGQEERRLSDGQIATLAAWADQGAPEGDPADAPAPPAPPPGLGEPDIVMDPGGDYDFANNVNDLYQCFRLPGSFAQATDIVAMDIEPGNKAVVHHVIVFREPNGAAKARGLPGFECGGVPPRTDFFFGWVPGAAPARFPEGMGMRLEPTDALVMQVHYHQAPGVVAKDRTRLKLYTAKAPVSERLRVVWTGSIDINVPAGGTATASGECVIPNGAGPVKVVSVAPHMHQAATAFKSTVTRGGQESCLVDVPRWDFEWQGGYQYKAPVILQAGDRIRTTCNYKNDTGAAIGFGEGTGDEMCFQFMFVVDDGSVPEKCFAPCNVIDCEALGF